MGSPGARHATYAYCLVRSRRRPATAGIRRGVPGASRHRALQIDDSLWLIVGNVPLATYGEAAIATRLRDLDWISRCAVAHEAVIERFIRREALVPMRLFTIFRNDDAARSNVRGARGRLNRILKRVARSLEWGVRLRRDPSTRKTARRDLRAPRSGAEYLRRKQDQLRHLKADLADTDRLATSVSLAAARHATAVRHHAVIAGADAANVVLDCSCLVPMASTASFRKAMRASARRASRSGHRLIITGPWPPYNFVGGPA